VNLKSRMFLTLVMTIGLLAPLAVLGRQQLADKTASTAPSALAPAAESPASPSDVQRITVDELKSKLASQESVVIIDVRGHDYDSSDSKIKGAVRIAPAQIQAHLADFPHDSQIVTYCSCPTDGGSVSAAKILQLNGFKNVRALKGGWNSWVQAGGATEPK
jgi:rhodanese-related sulfurtransferase